MLCGPRRGLSRASQIDSHPSDGFPHEAYFLPDAYKVPVPLSCLFLSATSLSLSLSLSLRHGEVTRYTGAQRLHQGDPDPGQHARPRRRN